MAAILREGVAAIRSGLRQLDANNNHLAGATPDPHFMLAVEDLLQRCQDRRVAMLSFAVLMGMQVNDMYIQVANTQPDDAAEFRNRMRDELVAIIDKVIEQLERVRVSEGGKPGHA